MSQSAWKAATLPKVQGSSNLHTLLPPQLDFFILLSSVSGAIGSPAQANYCAGNTYQDSLATRLLLSGRKAVALDLGWIATAGYVAEHERAAQNLRSAGFLMPIQEEELFGILEHYCNPNLELESFGSGQIVLGLELPKTLESQGKEVPEFMLSPAYRILHMQNSSQADASSVSGKAMYQEPKELLQAAENIAEGTKVVLNALIVKLSRTLSLDINGIDVEKPLYEHGIDSLSALEIKNWCGKAIGTDVGVLELLGAENLVDLATLVAAKSKFRGWKNEDQKT